MKTQQHSYCVVGEGEEKEEATGVELRGGLLSEMISTVYTAARVCKRKGTIQNIHIRTHTHTRTHARTYTHARTHIRTKLNSNLLANTYYDSCTYSFPGSYMSIHTTYNSSPKKERYTWEA